jgi:oligopeptide transport system substrate-binding protein
LSRADQRIRLLSIACGQHIKRRSEHVTDRSQIRSGVSLAALLTSGAFAQVVYNRGNDTDPTSLDHHKTSTVAEANLMRDLYEGS